jgi:hypothetical protein
MTPHISINRRWIAEKCVSGRRSEAILISKVVKATAESGAFYCRVGRASGEPHHLPEMLVGLYENRIAVVDFC